MSEHSPIGVLVLAAGSSTRMGQPKQLLPWADTTLLGYAVKQAQGLYLPITVVVGAHYQLLQDHLAGYDVNTAYNRAFTSGLGSSIAVGVKALLAKNQSYAAVLIMLADQPAVDTSYLNTIVEAHQQSPNEIIATRYPVRVGVPALFPAAYFDQLLSLGGDAGAGKLLNSMKSGIHLLTPPQPLFDIDTPEDYRRHEGNT